MICPLNGFLLLSVLCFSDADRLTLENDFLRATLNAQSGEWSVYDKEARIEWRQPSSEAVRLADAAVADGEIRFPLNGGLNARAFLQGRWLSIVIEGDPESPFSPLDYPSGFEPPSPQDAHLLLPNCAGLRLPLNPDQAPRLRNLTGAYPANITQRGLTMPWMATEARGGAGCLLLADNPEDAQFVLERGPSAFRYATGWLPVKGCLGFARRARYYFSPGGGYVALCKVYRKIAEQEGLLKTLARKKQENAHVDQLIGAMNLWIFDRPDLDLLERLKANGIERALVSFIHHGDDPAKEYESVEGPFARAVGELGLLIGRYDTYRTIFPPQRTGVRYWTRRIGFPEQCAVDKKGDFYPGFRGEKDRSNGHRCMVMQLKLIQDYLPKDLDQVPYTARFIDTVGATVLYECYSPAHPTLRREDIQLRQQMLGFVRDSGLVCGTEHAAQWTVPYVDYAEGLTTFVRCHTLNGDLSPSPLEVPDEYRLSVLNPAVRVPLWGLVFHDCLAATNRWNTTPNRFPVDDWRMRDLFNLLDGSMPTLLVDRQTALAQMSEIARSFRQVCAWNRLTGCEEMTDHQILTDDSMVHEIHYESGHAIRINFAAEPRALPDGAIIPPRCAMVRDQASSWRPWPDDESPSSTAQAK